jgi:hypothetical protein
MRLCFSPEDLAFQQDVRSFMAGKYPADLRGKQGEDNVLSKEDFLLWRKVPLKKGRAAPAPRGRHVHRGRADRIYDVDGHVQARPASR